MKKLLFVIMSIMAVALTSCFGSSKGSFKTGETLYPNQKCFGASTEQNFDYLVDACVKNDELRVELMVECGDVRVINTYEKCYVDKTGFSKSLVVLQDGTSWWVSNKFLRKK